MREIEAAGGIPFTAIVNNSNVGEETAAEDLTATFKIAEELSELSGLPVIAVTAEEKVAKNTDGAFPLVLERKNFDI